MNLNSKFLFCLFTSALALTACNEQTIELTRTASDSFTISKSATVPITFTSCKDVIKHVDPNQCGYQNVCSGQNTNCTTNAAGQKTCTSTPNCSYKDVPCEYVENVCTENVDHYVNASVKVIFPSAARLDNGVTETVSFSVSNGDGAQKSVKMKIKSPQYKYNYDSSYDVDLSGSSFNMVIRPTL